MPAGKAGVAKEFDPVVRTRVVGGAPWIMEFRFVCSTGLRGVPYL